MISRGNLSGPDNLNVWPEKAFLLGENMNCEVLLLNTGSIFRTLIRLIHLKVLKARRLIHAK